VAIWIRLVVVIYNVLSWRVDVISEEMRGGSELGNATNLAFDSFFRNLPSGPEASKPSKVFDPHDIRSKWIVWRRLLQVTFRKTECRRPGMAQQGLFQILYFAISEIIEVLKHAMVRNSIAMYAARRDSTRRAYSPERQHP
jgi:hypothetical protein